VVYLKPFNTRSLSQNTFKKALRPPCDEIKHFVLFSQPWLHLWTAPYKFSAVISKKHRQIQNFFRELFDECLELLIAKSPKKNNNVGIILNFVLIFKFLIGRKIQISWALASVWVISSNRKKAANYFTGSVHKTQWEIGWTKFREVIFSDIFFFFL
jgi:hypothetical protein